jgi:tetratricopeptide (TPR) repeat protein
VVQAGRWLGRYELSRRLGSSTVGEVWQAREDGSPRSVAVKVLWSPEPGSLQLLVREALVGTRVRHPHVVAVYDLVHVGEAWLTVMELLPGGPVCGPLPGDRLLELAIQVCDGLDMLHRLEPCGLVHGDIKPANLLLDGSGSLRIADLGSVAVPGERGSAGTPAYAAPEMGRSRVDERSDLYSLAVTLAELALGVEAWSVARRTTSEAREALREQRADVDALVPGLSALLSECLEVEPQRRPPSAEVLRRRFEELLPAPRPPLSGPPAEAPSPLSARDLLSPSARRALSELSVFEGPFTPQAAAAVLSCGLQELVDLGLVVQGPDQRLQIPGLVRAFVCEDLPPGERLLAEQRHGQYYASEGPAPPADLAEIEAACVRALRRGDAQIAVRSLVRLYGAARQKGPVAPFVELADKVLELPLGALERAEVLRLSATLEHRCGQMTSARARFGVALALQGASEQRCRTLVALGLLEQEGGEPERASDCYQAALELAQQLGDRVSQVKSLINLGNLEREQGRIELAERHYRAALALGPGDREDRALLTGNLGVLCVDCGRPAEALPLLREAGESFQALGNQRLLGWTLSNLGLALSVLGRLAEGRAVQQEALKLYRRLGLRREEGLTLTAMGNALLYAGAHQEAGPVLREALACHREVGNPRAEAMTTKLLGDLALSQGLLACARRTFQEAADAFRALGSPEGEAGVRLGFARVALSEQAPAEARSQLATVVADDLRGPFRVQYELVSAELAAREGEEETARAALQRAAAEAESFPQDALLSALLCEAEERIGWLLGSRDTEPRPVDPPCPEPPARTPAARSSGRARRR